MDRPKWTTLNLNDGKGLAVGLRVQASGLKVQGVRCGIGAKGSEFRVQGLGVGLVQGLVYKSCARGFGV